MEKVAKAKAREKASGEKQIKTHLIMKIWITLVTRHLVLLSPWNLLIFWMYLDWICLCQSYQVSLPLKFAVVMQL